MSDPRTVEAIQKRIDEVCQMLLTAPPDLDARQPLLRELESLQRRKQGVQPQDGKQVSDHGSAPPASTAGTKKRAPRKARPVDAAEEFAGFHWPEHQRGIPNNIARSGLFNVRVNEPRRVLDNEPIAALRGTSLLYSGEELRIRDEDVFMQCCHFQRAAKWGDPWKVTGRDFLLAMRWTDGERGYRDLYDALLRLSKGHLSVIQVRSADGQVHASGTDTEAAPTEANAISIPATDRSFALKAGALIEVTIAHDARRGARSWITVRMGVQSRALWETMGYTVLDWDQRLRLTKTLARFLHRFYASHAHPYAYKVETLRTLTGSATRDLSKFRQMLRDALKTLVDVGFLTGWSMDANDNVHVQRAPDPLDD